LEEGKLQRAIDEKLRLEQKQRFFPLLTKPNETTEQNNRATEQASKQASKQPTNQPNKQTNQINQT